MNSAEGSQFLEEKETKVSVCVDDSAQKERASKGSETAHSHALLLMTDLLLS